MRFKQFLVEDDTRLEGTIEGVDKVLANCKPYLQAIGLFEANNKEELDTKLADTVLLRGIKSSTTYVRKVPRADRRPTDTPIVAHQIIDQWFKQQFGIPIRSQGVFASTNIEQIGQYGSPYMIFPEGQRFKMVASSHVQDLFEHLSRQFWEQFEQSLGDFYRSLDSGIISNPKEAQEKARQLIIKTLQKADYQYYDPVTIKKQLPNHEILILCDSYYGLYARHPRHVGHIVSAFWQRIKEM